MNKKKIEDFKISGSRVLKVSKEDTPVRDVTNDAPISYTPTTSKSNNSKYDFLNKLNKKTDAFTQRIPQTPKLPNRKKSYSGKIILFIIILIIGVAFFLLNTIFFKANVKIVPKNKIIELNHQKINAGKLKSDNVPFEVMIVTDNDTKDIALSSSSEVSNKAKGEITLFNEYSNKSQKITAGTFISDDKGKSYKIDTTVSVPGYTLDKTKIIPGQISVGITSFIAGDTYNGTPDNFYITSFKGTNKYKKIYGKIKTPLAGGTAGLVYSLDDKEKESVLSNTVTFKERLLRKLIAQIPEGYIYYPTGVSYLYELGENITSKTPIAKVEMKGTLSAFIFKKDDLQNFIISKSLPDISAKEKSEILPSDLSSLSFSFVDNGQIVSKEIQNFNLDLSGNLSVDWKPSVDELRALLVGKNKSEVTSIFKQDPGIASATIKIIPFWSPKLPNEAKNINIIFK